MVGGTISQLPGMGEEEGAVTFHGRFMGHCIWICDRHEARELYHRGYFGKGVLSRSEPNYGLCTLDFIRSFLFVVF